MNQTQKPLAPCRRPGTLRLLASAGWLLLAITWGMSIYAYRRLPQDMASWTSLWVKDVFRVDKSVFFFVYPLAQTVVLLAIRALAKAYFLRPEAHRLSVEAAGRDLEVQERLIDLKKETVSLIVIFCNLIFIHLQTSLVLLSHRLASGVNHFYLIMLLAVLFILIPYYAIRRRLLLRTLY
ncbi:MAG: hypothetical protein QHH14_09525 [Clostridiales bacterium]|nr:hypothetical protein [Clostridiales bacterium]